MMKFSALNESSLSEDDGDPDLATREAQEEEAYSIYHDALRKQYESHLEESEAMFRELLEMEFLTEAHPSEEKSEAPLGPALTLKYLVYKNLASISKEKNDFQSAVAFYLEALEIDSSDVMMWYHMGKASINISNYSLARLCFEEGLKCSPSHWPCLDNVISVMYTLNDYANCLYYIAQALERETYYLKGLAFKDQIYKEDPSLKSFCDSYFKKCDPAIYSTEYDKEEADKFIQECLEMREKKRSFYKPKPLPILALGHPIKEYTWKNLGDSLIKMYDSIANADSSVSYSCKVDLSPFLENSSKTSELNGEKVTAQSPLSSLSEAFSSNSVPPTTGENQNASSVNPSSQDPTLSEMEIDETPCDNKSAHPDTLLLPQAEAQPTDLSMYNDSTCSARRTSKRKRSELAELSDFVSKRRSTRVRNPAIKRPQDNTNYQELLHKFLPAKLIGDGKFDDQDYDSDHFSQDKSSDLTNGQFSEKEKKEAANTSNISSTEKEEVCAFIAKNQTNGGIINLLYEYVVILSSKSNFTWPKSLIDAYIGAFSRLRKHITTPNLFSRSTESFRIKELGFAILVYCEFKVDQWYQNTGHSMSFSLKVSSGSGFPCNKIGNDFHSDMEFLVQFTSRVDILEKEWLNYSARALWLKAKFHSLEGEIDLAVSCMGQLYGVLSDEAARDMKITVQNCNNANIIAIGNVQQQLESLQRCQSLEEVQRLYEHGDYAAVVDLLVLTFNQPRASKKQSLDGVPERHAQLLYLQNSLMKLERYKECVYWSEVSFNEALQQFMNATKNSEWSETMAQLLSGLDKCAKLDSSYLSELEDSKLARLTQNLILVIVIQMENYDFAGDNAALLVVLPWIILYRLILNEEKRNANKTSGKALAKGNVKVSSTVNDLTDTDLSSAMPSSLMLLFAAHEYLGRRSWCTVSDGLLLLTFTDIMMAELQDSSGNSSLYREDLETGLEQCIYCLYGHPNKRSRAKHLTEHYAKQLTLTWERACLIFQYFKPNILPEFDSYRTSTISAELESLFKRISTLVSPEEDPTTRVDAYTAYIEGGTDKCPDPPFGNKELSIVVKDLYYLLGDYYFKNKEFSKAIKYYLYDICINPDRQDSWAGMALSRSSQLDQKLNSYELRNESTIYRKSSAALRCFEHALELDPTTTSLWIEYGSLAYILHSHAARQLKQETFCDELYDLLKKKEREMLEVAERCFRAANFCDDGGEPEEAWLHHYMLGKISEKKGEGPSIYLDHYRKAMNYLHEDFARYPQKILYHNPTELSIEALEVYYRVHASCLKYLWRHENRGIDLGTVKVIQQCLHAVKASPFCNFQEKCKTETAGSSSNVASEIEEVQPFKVVESQPEADHNYYDSADKSAKKISEVSRRNRPSTDSLPESQDLLTIKEILDSLVAVVTERFVDEAKEKSVHGNAVSAVSENNHDFTKLIVESVAEESVYTTKNSTEKSTEAETDPLKQIISSDVSSTLLGEIDEFAKLQELAKELETKAASFILEEEKKEDNSVVDSKTKEGTPLEVDAACDPSDKLNKDDEVLMSLSSILSSLEAVKKSDSDIKVQEHEMMQTEDSSVKSEDKNEENKNNTNLQNPEVLIVVQSHSGSLVKSDEAQQSNSDGPVNSTGKVEISVNSQILKGEQLNKNNGCMKDKEHIKSAKSENQSNDTILPEKNSENVDKILTSGEKKRVKSSASKEKGSSSSKSVLKSDGKNSKSKVTLPVPSPEELKRSKESIAKLIPKCLDAMRECLQRFPQHYKALYRMAHYYCHSKYNKNLQWAREILLAATPITKKYPAMAGLFAERKNTNFFNGIWRAPSNEIDRAGSFGAHMYRSVNLLIEVLNLQNDYNMLVYLTQQLYRTPDLGKKYMRDTDRVFLVRKSYDACVNILREKMNSLLQEEPPPEESQLVRCLLEIYRTCVTLWKAGINVEDTNDLLEEAYTMYRIGEVDSHPTVLEQATKFCQIQLSKTYPDRMGRDAVMLEEHMLQPLYNQPDPSKPSTSSKYLASPDVTMIHENASVPSASAFNTDAWQKELAESLMMPTLPREGRTNPEAKPAKSDTAPPQDPLTLISVEPSFNNPPLPSVTPNIPQHPAIPSQMVHVEKPRAENFQACSMAFLPVAPAYPKEPINTPPVFQAPPLLSCQAFECFDVLSSIMQASGYQVAPQIGMAQPFNPVIDIYNMKSHHSIPNIQRGYGSYPPKMLNMRLGRKRRRGRPYRMEGLNLSRKLHTKPIVSATIANSIAQLKVDGITTSDTKPQLEAVQTSPLCLVKPKPSKRIPCYKASTQSSCKGLDLSKKPPLVTATSAQCSVIVSTSETLKPKFTPDYSEKPKISRKEKKIIADMLPDIYDFTDDSNLSTNLETSRIEKCAKEMLQFMNQKVEDNVLNSPNTTATAVSKDAIQGTSIPKEESAGTSVPKSEADSTCVPKGEVAGNSVHKDGAASISMVEADIDKGTDSNRASMKSSPKDKFDLKSSNANKNTVGIETLARGYEDESKKINEPTNPFFNDQCLAGGSAHNSERDAVTKQPTAHSHSYKDANRKSQKDNIIKGDIIKNLNKKSKKYMFGHIDEKEATTLGIETNTEKHVHSKGKLEFLHPMLSNPSSTDTSVSENKNAITLKSLAETDLTNPTISKANVNKNINNAEKNEITVATNNQDYTNKFKNQTELIDFESNYQSSTNISVPNTQIGALLKLLKDDSGSIKDSNEHRKGDHNLNNDNTNIADNVINNENLICESENKTELADTVLNDQYAEDISIPKSEMENIMKLFEVENDPQKYSDSTPLKAALKNKDSNEINALKTKIRTENSIYESSDEAKPIDPIISDQFTTDISIPKSEIDGILKMLEVESGPNIDSNSSSTIGAISEITGISVKTIEIEKSYKTFVEESGNKMKPAETEGDNLISVDLLESIDQFSKDSAEKFTLLFPKLGEVDIKNEKDEDFTAKENLASGEIHKRKKYDDCDEDMEGIDTQKKRESKKLKLSDSEFKTKDIEARKDVEEENVSSKLASESIEELFEEFIEKGVDSSVNLLKMEECTEVNEEEYIFSSTVNFGDLEPKDIEEKHITIDTDINLYPLAEGHQNESDCIETDEPCLELTVEYSTDSEKQYFHMEEDTSNPSTDIEYEDFKDEIGIQKSETDITKDEISVFRNQINTPKDEPDISKDELTNIIAKSEDLFTLQKEEISKKKDENSILAPKNVSRDEFIEYEHINLTVSDEKSMIKEEFILPIDESTIANRRVRNVSFIPKHESVSTILKDENVFIIPREESITTIQNDESINLILKMESVNVLQENENFNIIPKDESISVFSANECIGDSSKYESIVGVQQNESINAIQINESFNVIQDDESLNIITEDEIIRVLSASENDSITSTNKDFDIIQKEESFTVIQKAESFSIIANDENISIFSDDKDARVISTTENFNIIQPEKCLNVILKDEIFSAIEKDQNIEVIQRAEINSIIQKDETIHPTQKHKSLNIIKKDESFNVISKDECIEVTQNDKSLNVDENNSVFTKEKNINVIRKDQSISLMQKSESINVMQKNETLNVILKEEITSVLLKDENISTPSKDESIILTQKNESFDAIQEDVRAEIFPNDGNFSVSSKDKLINETKKHENIHDIQKDENTNIIQKDENINIIQKERFSVLSQDESIRVFSKEKTIEVPSNEKNIIANQKVDNINEIKKDEIMNVTHEDNEINAIQKYKSVNVAKNDESINAIVNESNSTFEEKVILSNTAKDEIVNIIPVKESENGTLKNESINAVPKDENVLTTEEEIEKNLTSIIMVPKDRESVETNQENVNVTQNDDGTDIEQVNESNYSHTYKDISDVPQDEYKSSTGKTVKSKKQNSLSENTNNKPKGKTIVPRKKILPKSKSILPRNRNMPKYKRVRRARKKTVPKNKSFRPIESDKPKNESDMSSDMTKITNNSNDESNMLKDEIEEESGRQRKEYSCASLKNIDKITSSIKLDTEHYKATIQGCSGIGNIIKPDIPKRECVVVISLKDNCSRFKYETSKIKNDKSEL